jgi:hypothetical protein
MCDAKIYECEHYYQDEALDAQARLREALEEFRQAIEVDPPLQ